MESDQRHYELRSGSRSRSQTPLVPNRTGNEQENMERHYDLRSRSRERSHTPGEVSSSRRSGSRSLHGCTVKSRDQSIGAIAERKEEVVAETATEYQREKTDVSVSSTGRKTERRSERQKAKRQIFANGQNESWGEQSGQKSDPNRRSASPRRILTSDYSSEEGEHEDLPSQPTSAYKIYKQAGEWWNVFPKTDYTYSQKSQCRYEIAPGVLAMPNMSRCSIHSDGNSTYSNTLSNSQKNLSQLSQDTAESGLGDTVDTPDTGESKERSVYNTTSVEESRRPPPKTRAWDSPAEPRMYEKWHAQQYKNHREIMHTVTASSGDLHQRHSWTMSSDGSSARSIIGDARKYGVTGSQVDSDAELEEAVALSRNTCSRKLKVQGWLSRFAAFIVLWFSKVLDFLHLRTVRRREYRTTYEYHRYHESKWTRLGRYVDHSLQHVYRLMLKVFFVDSWLLSRVSGTRTWLQERGQKLVWISILPLLLLTVCWWFPYLSVILASTNREATGPFIHPSATPASLLAATLRQPEDFKAILAQLSSRLDSLEFGSNVQTEHLLNVSRVLQEHKGNVDDVWTKYNTKIIALDERLSEKGTNDENARQIHAIKVEFDGLRELYTELKSCCENRAQFLRSEDLEAGVEKTMADYFGRSASKEDLARIIENLMVAPNGGQSTRPPEGGTVSDGTEKHMREIVKEALRIYDADKTGTVDYALESAGGQVMSTRCTQRYDQDTRALKFFGLMFHQENSDPRTVIQGNPIQPGICWAFQGFPGYLLIKLRSSVYVTGFTMEHAPKSILPNEEMKSAPRKFDVWGFTSESDPEPVHFGDYEFTDMEDNLQYFPVQNTEIVAPFEYVELRVQSNHGQLEYTCLYRFRVHGRSS